jgi:hypothetical protein
MATNASQLKFKTFETELLNPLAGHKLTALEEYVASYLLTASSHAPIKIAEIIRAVRREKQLAVNERTVKDVVRTLRKQHRFPILSRRKKPAGLWWCGSASEMEAFIESFRQQALDELHTLGRIVKENYPQFEGQLSFEDILATDAARRIQDRSNRANASEQTNHSF